jgi:hypothetical protein
MRIPIIAKPYCQCCKTGHQWRNSPGLDGIGTLAPIIVRAPFTRPELPSPATARPIINILEDWATPHNTEPNSKRARKARKVYCHKSATRKQWNHELTRLGAKLRIEVPSYRLKRAANTAVSFVPLKRNDRIGHTLLEDTHCRTILHQRLSENHW